jgi:hypothetical protein
MAGYGDIVTGTQEFYSDFSEASRSVSEATGSYFGKMREQKAKEGRWNQTLDAGFSLFKGYQEGAQEHADAANVAKEAGFEYKQPDTLWDTYQGVDKDQMHTRYFKDKEGVEQFQQISGTDLKNMSDLYKAGGTKSLGDVSEYGTVNKSYTSPGQYTSENPIKEASPYEDMTPVGQTRRSGGGIEMGKFHKEFMGGTDKSSLQYQEKFNQQNINSLTRQARRVGGQDMTSEKARDAARDLFGDSMYDMYVSRRQFARRELKGFE